MYKDDLCEVMNSFYLFHFCPPLFLFFFSAVFCQCYIQPGLLLLTPSCNPSRPTYFWDISKGLFLQRAQIWDTCIGIFGTVQGKCPVIVVFACRKCKSYAIENVLTEVVYNIFLSFASILQQVIVFTLCGGVCACFIFACVYEEKKSGEKNMKFVALWLF